MSRTRPTPRPTPRTGSFGPVRPAPVPPPDGTQQTMFGPPAGTPPRPGRRPGHSTSDRDLIVTVLRLATEPGYLLIGAAEHVVRRDDGDPNHAATPPRHEADTVAQLLDSGHLVVGGHRHITVAERSGPARAVLVPARTRQQLARWAALGLTDQPAGGRP